MAAMASPAKIPIRVGEYDYGDPSVQNKMYALFRLVGSLLTDYDVQFVTLDESMNFDLILQMVGNGSFSCLAVKTFITLPRMKWVNYSEPLYQSDFLLFVPMLVDENRWQALLTSLLLLFHVFAVDYWLGLLALTALFVIALLLARQLSLTRRMWFTSLWSLFPHMIAQHTFDTVNMRLPSTLLFVAIMSFATIFSFTMYQSWLLAEFVNPQLVTGQINSLESLLVELEKRTVKVDLTHPTWFRAKIFFESQTQLFKRFREVFEYNPPWFTAVNGTYTGSAPLVGVSNLPSTKLFPTEALQFCKLKPLLLGISWPVGIPVSPTLPHLHDAINKVIQQSSDVLAFVHEDIQRQAFEQHDECVDRYLKSQSPVMGTALGMAAMQGYFVVWLAGALLALVMFSGETCSKFWSKMCHPPKAKSASEEYWRVHA